MYSISKVSMTHSGFKVIPGFNVILGTRNIPSLLGLKYEVNIPCISFTVVLLLCGGSTNSNCDEYPGN